MRHLLTLGLLLAGCERDRIQIVEVRPRMASPVSEPLRPDRTALMYQTWHGILAVESDHGQDQDCWIEKPTGELGPAQMLRIRVDDVNQILGRKVYTYEDRLDGHKCWLMFQVSCDHYWPEGTPEQWARHWNGSPTTGPKIRATLNYWHKVQRAMLEQS